MDGKDAFSTPLRRVIIMLFIGFVIYLVMTMEMENINTESMHSDKSRKQPLLGYFNISNGIYLTWAHAVNSKLFLNKVLSDASIMMLEADVVMDPDKKVPIMAHPPATSSDIDLDEWLTSVSRTNKGVKLDFKQDSALTDSYHSIIQFLSNDQNVDVNRPPTSKSDNHRPVILNADILLGPNSGPTAKPVNQELFISTCKKIASVVVSPGWVTGFVKNSAGYSWENVHEMYTVVKDLQHEITFPIRASLALISSEQLIWLLEQNVGRFSLTVWTSTHDEYDVKSLLFLRKFKERVYFDLPLVEKQELMSLFS